MTDPGAEPRPGKRERLVASAAELIHRQGVQRTTLSEIAQAADVPPGNVYYYFKTREELLRAVIDSWAERFGGLVESFEEQPNPRVRLKALARFWAEDEELVAASGCPVGSLCSELNKQEAGLSREAAELFKLLLAWAQDQFRQLGCRGAREHAFTLLAGLQGAALLADTFDDPALMTRQVRRLERWIDSLA
ncbi:MAG: TetR/AcrR family transcriptional regulator [Solirubrobacteraceae bacterium]